MGVLLLDDDRCIAFYSQPNQTSVLHHKRRSGFLVPELKEVNKQVEEMLQIREEDQNIKQMSLKLPRLLVSKKSGPDVSKKWRVVDFYKLFRKLIAGNILGFKHFQDVSSWITFKGLFSFK